MNFIALWIRIITIILVAIIGIVIVFWVGKKQFKTLEKIVTIVLILGLILLGYIGSSTRKSLINPDIKTFVGVYESEARVNGVSPLQMEYCFDCDGEKIYCDLDLISKNKIYNKDFKKGKKYTISYETNSNLIVAVSENDQEETNNTNLNNEVNGMQLLDFLKQNITNQNTTDEIIDVFKQMCKTPIEEDLLLLEYGVYDFDSEDLFYFDLVRQYPDGEGEYYQLRVSLMFAPDKENRKLNDTLWSDDTDEDFFDYIRKSSGYNYAKNHSFKSIDIRIDQT